MPKLRIITSVSKKSRRQRVPANYSEQYNLDTLMPSSIVQTLSCMWNLLRKTWPQEEN